MTDTKQHHRIIMTTSGRQGRPLRPAQQELVNHLLPRLSIDCHAAPLEPSSVFKQANLHDYALEIGFGSGEHLLYRALHEAQTGFIGCEMYPQGVASCIAAIHQHEEKSGKQLSNLKIWNQDARILMSALPEASLHRIYLMFPDPWPKKRHWKRRMIQADFIKESARLIMPGGQFILASDHADYREWSLVHFANSEEFELQARTYQDCLAPPDGHHQTRYERKGKAGFPMFFSFLRRNA